MLIDQQIQYLYEFCDRNGIRYYDLKLEIVDHLATEIEQEKEINSGYTFDDSLKAVFDRFGKEKFSSIVRQKEEYINQEYFRYHSSYFWSFFTLPKIILTILIAVCLILPFHYASREIVIQLHKVYFAVMLLIGSTTVVAILIRFKKTAQPILLLKGVKRKSLGRNLGLILAAVLNSWPIFKREFPSGSLKYLVASGMIIMTISYSVVFFARLYAAQKMYFKAKRQYPLAFKS